MPVRLPAWSPGADPPASHSCPALLPTSFYSLRTRVQVMLDAAASASVQPWGAEEQLLLEASALPSPMLPSNYESASETCIVSSVAHARLTC